MKRTKSLSPKQPKPGESAVLEQIQRLASSVRLRGSGLVRGIGDDAALFRPTPGFDQVLTCDWFLEGTHFLRDKHPPDAIGWKCLARAVSDIAAMGGVPRCFLLSLALPASHTGAWLQEFLGGLGRAARHLACVLAGGDTTQRKDILINVSVVGEVKRSRALLRSGARAGDILFTSGRLGEADLGLRRLRRTKALANRRDPLLQKHLYPEPRLPLGRWLAETGLASAMMDLSDGLSTDLPRLCAASRVGARIATTRIPTAKTPRASQSRYDLLNLGLHGGDDYELLFTVPRRKLPSVPRAFHGLPITAIGEITHEQKLLLVDEKGHEIPLPNRGWDPFRNSSETPR